MPHTFQPAGYSSVIQNKAGQLLNNPEPLSGAVEICVGYPVNAEQSGSNLSLKNPSLKEWALKIISLKQV